MPDTCCCGDSAARLINLLVAKSDGRSRTWLLLETWYLSARHVGQYRLTRVKVKLHIGGGDDGFFPDDWSDNYYRLNDEAVWQCLACTAEDDVC